MARDLTKMFRLKQGAGDHDTAGVKGAQTTFKSKENKIIHSEIDLVKQFPNKFERVFPQQIRSEKAAQEAGEAVESPVDDESSSSIGQVVTSRFKAASDLKVIVYEKDGTYSVADAKDPLVALNEEPLSKKGVKEFLKTFDKDSRHVEESDTEDEEDSE